MLMDISVKDLQSDMIKPSNNGELENVVDPNTHKLLISNTTLRSFLPPYVQKMTPKLCHIWGCKI